MNLDRLRKQLINDEDLRLRIYTDTVGKVTGGVGRNLTDKGFSMGEVLLMLDNDIKEAVKQLDVHCAWWRKMSEVRQEVILNMCFNLGIGKLLTFTTTLGHMQAGEYKQAAGTMLQSLWAKQVGQRAKRLSDMMKAG